MKTLIKVGLLLTGMVCPFLLSAQVAPGAFGYYEDALRFSSTNPGGSARIQAMGGAQTALGGDVSSAYSNPAGLGFFNQSTFVGTPGINFQTANSNFLDQSNRSTRSSFNINNLGVVIEKTKGPYAEDKFKGGSFGFSLTRTNDFQYNYGYEGFNDFNSIVDFFLQQSDGIPESNIDNRGAVSLAYYNYLINPVPDEVGRYDSFVIGFPRQAEVIESRGSQYQMSASYGANYDDKIYFGAGVGIPVLGQTINKIYIEDSFEFFDEESGEWVADDAINDIILEESIRSNGIGINGTFGVIYRPVNLFRVGLSYTTPTIMSMNDESTSTLFTNYNEYYFAPEDTVLGSLFSEGEIIVSNYTLTTPGRLNAGVALFLGKNGFITGDVEFVNYGGASLSSNDFSTAGDNETIENLYTNVINYRLGAELRFDAVRLRGGYSYMADPVANSTFDTSVSSYSAGLGYRTQDYFVDLAFVNRSNNQLYAPYALADGSQPVAEISNRVSSFLLSVGFNF
ncbi:MAG: long-chain fatty acid transporter [Cyclobacteriaceae bacterium]